MDTKELYEKLKSKYFKKLFAFAIIFTMFYIMKDLLNIFILTFLITFLISSLNKALTKQIRKIFHIDDVIVSVFIYLIIFVMIIYSLYKYLPITIKQVLDILDELKNFDYDKINYSSSEYINFLLKHIDIKKYILEGTQHVFVLMGQIGHFTFDFIAALVLSMFFMFEKYKVLSFVRKFKESKISWLYGYFKNLSTSFIDSFGKVLQSQFVVAIVNSIATIVFIYFLKFNHIIGLGVLVFILSLIPVVGTIISVVPLSIIAFDVGGINYIILIISFIIIFHAFISYYLYPKLMSHKVNLPTFFIFIVLIIVEHFLGVWGLLLGIPLFIFILDLLEVDFS
ncbi:pheromone autoinducer 2 transporter [Caloramator mitchellensis]|uniref:Pheromone autoinducer 2 transporter n=1 Tax=Caloramator mitchellensis TaxID=908809 RepID=A0A0R3K0A7_CALMK|nr:AI-2E family transporter [Caloramator mitchellensis]KRQ87965.1 pheromone autoinducer 2 transporter [Caloramator mitchellensis]